MQNKINAFTSKSMNLVAIKNNYISNYMVALYFLAVRIIGKTLKTNIIVFLLKYRLISRSNILHIKSNKIHKDFKL